MDKDLKEGMESACKEMGMSMTTAFTIYAKKVSKERRIPFEVAADPDPFYSEANLSRLRQAIKDIRDGENITVHELLEVDDD
jgi:DNA-damage-inducible protein J